MNEEYDFSELLGKIVYNRDNKKFLVIAVNTQGILLGGFTVDVPLDTFFNRFSITKWENRELFEFDNMYNEKREAIFNESEIHLFGSGCIPYVNIKEVSLIENYVFINKNMQSKSRGEINFSIKEEHDRLISMSLMKFIDENTAKRFYDEVTKKIRTTTIRDIRSRLGGTDAVECVCSFSIVGYLAKINSNGSKTNLHKNIVNALFYLNYLEHKGDIIILSKIGIDLLRSSITYKG